jgi:hypothetical protein
LTDRNSADKQLKVTDKRMFTPDGELRDEYKELEAAAAAKRRAEADAPVAAPSNAPSGAAQSAAAPSRLAAPGPAPGSPAQPQPAKTAPAPAYPSGAQFEDLVALLAQTTVTFLQQTSRPEGRRENLDQAQLYLDLLGILDDKTTGNLVPAEKAMLQDALRQLRLAFAQRG